MWHSLSEGTYIPELQTADGLIECVLRKKHTGIAMAIYMCIQNGDHEHNILCVVMFSSLFAGSIANIPANSLLSRFIVLPRI